MTATDELRRLLDGRGVEWVAIGTDTCWTGADGYPMRAWETTNGTHMRVADLTPAQAVEATLGRGENEQLRKERDALDHLTDVLNATNDGLLAENAKLRELLVGAFEDMNAWQMVIAGSNEWGYGKGCLDSLCKLRDAMQELGMEVVV